MNCLKNISFKVILTMIISLLGLMVNAQNKKKNQKNAKADTAQVAKTDIKVSPKPVSLIKPYSDVVPKGAKSMRSFINIHIVADRVLFEVPDSVLLTDILVVTRINKGPADFKIPLINIGYSGDETGRATINFERIPGDKIAMRSTVYRQFSNDTTANGLSRSLINNNYQTIQAVFPIKAINAAGKSMVIDLTDFINGDNSLLTFEGPLLRVMLAGLAADRSYVENVKAFPMNVEIKSVKTYFSKPGTFGTPPPVTFQFNNSFVLLPKRPMIPRLADPRIGYFSNSYNDFDSNPFGVKQTKYIVRWRMEPKDEDIVKYNAGELVEPKKPIVIYIDPATPHKWVPYLIKGINDWQVAFEKAGFKNAIIGKEVPLDDSTFSIDDARHSVVVYKPSEVPNAMGPNINDPRTGEILETHISWFHSVMTLLQNWYVVQAGAIDPRTHQPELDEKLMGELIRFVSSHEIGHTLGLMHNFGASSTVPVEKLRNKEWVEAHGHTPSIMDYARFNYVAQPEDGISEKGIFPRIGDYDKWAIEWGYRFIPETKRATDEKSLLNKWIIDKLAGGKQFFYGSQLSPFTNEFPMNEFDPRSQSEDLGDDAMLASSYGIKNLKRIRPQISVWFKKPGENYRRSGEVYAELVNQYGRYMGHVLRNIGGLYQTPKTSEQSGTEETIVPKAKQKRAMAFLQKELFTTPEWIKDSKLYGTSEAGFSKVALLQNQVLTSLLSSRRINVLIEEESAFGKYAYSATEMLNDLKTGIFSELKREKIEVSMNRRDIQKKYVENLAALIAPLTSVRSNDNLSIAKEHARVLEKDIRKILLKAGQGITRAHLNDLAERLHTSLNPR